MKSKYLTSTTTPCPRNLLQATPPVNAEKSSSICEIKSLPKPQISIPFSHGNKLLRIGQKIFTLQRIIQLFNLTSG